MIRASILALMICASPAFAQMPQCGPRADVLAQLAGKWGEAPRAMGLIPSAGVMEMFANAETGTWTATITSPDGKTCIVAAGADFETMDAPKPGVDG
jgi:hypothetical protein